MHVKRWFSKLIHGRPSAKLQVRIHSILLSLLEYFYGVKQNYCMFTQFAARTALFITGFCIVFLSSACSYSSS